MGKATHAALLNHWRSELSTIDTLEGRSVSAKKEGKGLCFVYKFPDVEVSLFNIKSLKISNITVFRLDLDKAFSAQNSCQSHMQHTSRR